MAKAKLPDGSILEVADGATVADLAAQIGPGLARVALAAKINDQLMDLSTPLIGEVDAAPELLATTDQTIADVADGAVRYAGSVGKLLT